MNVFRGVVLCLFSVVFLFGGLYNFWASYRFESGLTGAATVVRFEEHRSRHGTNYTSHLRLREIPGEEVCTITSIVAPVVGSEFPVLYLTDGSGETICRQPGAASQWGLPFALTCCGFPFSLAVGIGILVRKARPA